MYHTVYLQALNREKAKTIFQTINKCFDWMTLLSAIHYI